MSRSIPSPPNADRESSDSLQRIEFRDCLARHVNGIRKSLGLQALSVDEITRLASGLSPAGVPYRDHHDQAAHIEYILGPVESRERDADFRRAVSYYEKRLILELGNAEEAEDTGDYVGAAQSYLATHQPDQALKVIRLLDPRNRRESGARHLMKLIRDQMSATRADE